MNKDQAPNLAKILMDICQIRDGLAEFETRILFQENLHTPADSAREKPVSEDRIEIPSKAMPAKEHIANLYAQLQQLKGRMLWNENKFNEHIDKGQQKQKPKGAIPL